MYRQIIGKIGECYAIKHLIKHKHFVIDTNYFTKYGEIDIISFDYSKREIAFTEVKSSGSQTNIDPLQNFTQKKYYRIMRSILHFRNNHPKYRQFPWRIDLITIKLTKDLRVKLLKTYKNIENG